MESDGVGIKIDAKFPLDKLCGKCYNKRANRISGVLFAEMRYGANPLT